MDLSEKDILHYKSSDNFIHEQELYKRFLDRKVKLKRNMTIKSTIEVLKNKYFYLLLIEYGVLKWREAEWGEIVLLFKINMALYKVCPDLEDGNNQWN